MDHIATTRPRRGIALAFGCLILLGVMPIITNGRPEGASALSFAFWLSLWQLLFSLPLLVLEWHSGERGLFTTTLARSRQWRIAAITLFTGALFGLSTWLYVLVFEQAGAVNAAIALQAYRSSLPGWRRPFSAAARACASSASRS